MPRSKRLDIPGAIHHVIVRGLERRRIFNDDNDYLNFISRIEKSIKRTNAFCYAWVLMPNHLHLLIRTGKNPLSDIMRSVLTGYAVYYNKKNRRHGYLYQNRYKSILCQEEPYLLKLAAYIHLNPLRAGIVKDLKELGLYRWCGHAAIIGTAKYAWQDTDYILSLFARRAGEARKKYIEFVKSQMPEMKSGQFSSGGLRRSCGGWQGVERLKIDKEYWRGDERLLGDSSFVDEVLKSAEEHLDKREKLLRKGWTLDRIISRVCALFDVEEPHVFLKGRQDTKSQAKAVICYLAHHDMGIHVIDIARRFKMSNVAVSKNIRNGTIIVEEKRINGLESLS
jgi:REP element-mobilizing transposase RayT